MKSQAEKRMKVNREEEEHGTEMECVHNRASEVYNRVNCQNDFFLTFQPQVLSTHEYQLFTINFYM